ncbi:RDD family protein [uncultured Jatrophihabitans sp.]|uniref:RDD family protein n=1 Tax=uncultured Jatrophihabitans sp. TaxID=1610747 RepID=UPI0035CB4ED4
MTTPQAYRGEKLGLPASGSGSLTSFGPRLGAFVVDTIASTLVASLFVRGRGSTFVDKLPGSWSLIPLAVDYLVGILLAGRTVGMYLFSLRVIRVDRTAAVDPWRALVRTVLLFLLVPALVFDRDGRGLQDRLTDTAVVRS